MHGGQCPIVKYPELEDTEMILDYLNKYGFVVILFLNSKNGELTFNYGHWICLTVSPSSKINKNKKLSITFFDPYGISVDMQKEYVPDEYLKLSDQERHYLTEFLYKLSNVYNIEYNEKKLQTKRKGTNTCGRHCIIRIINKDIPLEKYQKVLMEKGGLNPDQKVVKLTNWLMQGKITIEDIQDLFKEVIEIKNEN